MRKEWRPDCPAKMTPADIAHLFSLTNEYRSAKYDLRNVHILLERLGNPHQSFRSILVAGTNGKGSVVAMLSAMMPEAGVYTSPHLQRLNERFRIGSAEISDEDLTVVYAEVAAAAADTSGFLYPPTYFEMTTAIAFTYFRDRVKFAILEVGLGGRLDATNVVHQDVSVITSIGLDHQAFLGNTLEQIAVEKAGIIKSSEPVVIGPEAEYDIIRQHAAGRLYGTKHLQREARSLGRGLFELDVTTPIRQYRGLKPALAGRHQLDNVVVAIRAAECLKLPRERIIEGVNSAVWPGRLETIPGTPSFLLDGAHNDMAMQALCSALEEFYPGGVRMIFGCMSDKDYKEMLQRLQPHVRDAIFTKVAGSRSKEPGELQALWPGSRVVPSPAQAIAQARREASPDDTVLICGSLYLIGEARAVLHSL
jgi:dihydrofolate synthase / folylpolyglutamate synthase